MYLPLSGYFRMPPFAAWRAPPDAEPACRPRALPRCRSAQWPSFWRAVRRPSGCGRRHPQHRLPSAVPHAVRPALAASRACSCCCTRVTTRVGQAISEMEGTCHQTWMAELAPERDAIGTWAVDEIGTFGPRRNQLQLGMMEPWQMCDRRAGMAGTTDPSRP